MSSHTAFILKVPAENKATRLIGKFAVGFAFHSIYLYINCFCLIWIILKEENDFLMCKVWLICKYS